MKLNWDKISALKEASSKIITVDDHSETLLTSLSTRGAARDFGPHEKNLYRPPNTAAKFVDAILHTMHFNGIFDYHYHICERRAT